MSAEQETQMPLVARSAEGILAGVWGGPVDVGGVTPLTSPERKNLVLRCHLAEAPTSAPATVIVKQAGRRGYDPDDPASPAWLLFNEWAGSAFVSRLPGDRPGGPHVYGGDREAGILVLEDVAGDSLAALLSGADPVRAEAALERLARRLGELHAATSGRRAEYAALRAALGPDPRPPTEEKVQFLHQAITDGPAALATVGITVDQRFVKALQAVAASLAEPGPFLAYTHGDPCPENCYDDGSTLRLIDFEFGGFRHALLDGVNWHMAFPTSPNSQQLSAALADRLETAYRQALLMGCPEAGDEAHFRRAVLDGCAYWTFNWLRRPLGEARPRLRRRIVTRTRTFARLAAVSTSHHPLADVALRIADAIVQRWPEEADGVPAAPALARD
ncbi:MAG: hypothetical protein ACR2JY_23685 [Chloroflexota bacterium]